jgi:hypothetical protein
LLCAPGFIATPRQAFGVWQWYNHLCAAVPVGRRVLNVNLDETSVAFFHGHQKGNVVFRKRPWGASEDRTQGATRRELRGAMTHIGLICDDPSVQPRLPQVMVISERLLRARDLHGVRAGLEANVYVLRKKSGWNSVDIMCAVVRVLGTVLRDVFPERQAVFLMDAAPIHLAERVLRACARWRLWPVLIPARMTWLLQPCDTHAFHRYKAYLRQLFQDERSRTRGGEVLAPVLIRLVCETIRGVLQGTTWHRAFVDNGFCAGQRGVCSYIRGSLGLTIIPALPSSRPTAEALESVLPRGSHVLSDLFFLRAAPALPPPLPPPAFPPGDAQVAPADPVSTRMGEADSGAHSSAEARPSIPRGIRLPGLPWHLAPPVRSPTSAEAEEAPTAPMTRARTAAAAKAASRATPTRGSSGSVSRS